MAFIVKKKIAGKTYYYLRESIRENGKIKAKTLAYLGKNKKLSEKKTRVILKEIKNRYKKSKEQAIQKVKNSETNIEVMAEEKNQSINKEESEFRKSLMSFVYEKGFVYGPSPEIYGGMAGFFDFGPVGKTLKNNIENSIRRLFNQFQFFEVECPIVTTKIVWEASGHLGGFSDPLVKFIKCSSIWRVDNIVSEQFEVDGDSMTLEQLKEFL